MLAVITPSWWTSDKCHAHKHSWACKLNLWSQNENNLAFCFLCIFVYFMDQEILLNPEIGNILFLIIQHSKYFKAFTNSLTHQILTFQNGTFLFRRVLLPLVCVFLYHLSTQRSSPLHSPHVSLCKSKLLPFYYQLITHSTCLHHWCELLHDTNVECRGCIKWVDQHIAFL